MSTNARSLNSKIEELKATAADLSPEVIAVTETWTNPSICSSYLNICGYKLVARKDRADTSNGRGGGIVVYVKSSIICHEIETPSEIIQVAAVQTKMTDHGLNIYVVYRSPNSSVENNIQINDFIRSVPANSIIVGDFNYPNVDWELMCSNGNATDFVDAINEHFLTQHVTFPTHDGGNTLDLVISNIPSRVSSLSEVGKLGNSDHSIILTEVLGTVSSHIPQHTIWNFKFAKLDDMKKALREIQWNEILVNDVDTDWDCFKKTITCATNSFSKKQLKK